MECILLVANTYVSRRNRFCKIAPGEIQKSGRMWRMDREKGDRFGSFQSFTTK